MWSLSDIEHEKFKKRLDVLEKRVKEITEQLIGIESQFIQWSETNED